MPRIQIVPALYVSELFALGKLPSAPPSVLESARVPGRRDMTLSEAAAVTWLIAGPADNPSGVTGYQDGYDFQTSSDIRLLVHIAGSARACVELIRFLIADSRAQGRRCMGIVDKSNAKMTHLLRRLGGVSVRERWESR